MTARKHSANSMDLKALVAKDRDLMKALMKEALIGRDAPGGRLEDPGVLAVAGTIGRYQQVHLVPQARKARPETADGACDPADAREIGIGDHQDTHALGPV